MNKEDLVPHDIALATMARGMFARLLTEEDKNRIAALHSTEDLTAFLRHTEGWDLAMKALPPADVTAELFSLELERHLYREYERLYRFAQATAKEFLIFMALRSKCQAVLAALRGLISPGAKPYVSPLPPFFQSMQGCEIGRLAKVKTFDELVEASGEKLYAEALRRLERDPVTGLPPYSTAAIALEERYYYMVANRLLGSYAGPDKEGLVQSVGFKADLLSVSYILRLRRFNTPAEQAMDILTPIPGTIGETAARAILSAGDEAEVVRLVSAALRRRNLGEIDRVDDAFLREAETAYFRKVIHGEPTLSVAYAFLMLKLAECEMLKRVYVALQYGLDPGAFIT